jgi:hypothetical protein
MSFLAPPGLYLFLPLPRLPVRAAEGSLCVYRHLSIGAAFHASAAGVRNRLLAALAKEDRA